MMVSLKVAEEFHINFFLFIYLFISSCAFLHFSSLAVAMQQRSRSLTYAHAQVKTLSEINENKEKCLNAMKWHSLLM